MIELSLLKHDNYNLIKRLFFNKIVSYVSISSIIINNVNDQKNYIVFISCFVGSYYFSCTNRIHLRVMTMGELLTEHTLSMNNNN